MKFKPYPFQLGGVEHAVNSLATAVPKQLYYAPTGCGKSIVELLVQERLPNLWIVTPREEIIDGMLDKLGVTGDCWNYRISTPIRMRNALLKGVLPHPDGLIIDECHHHNAETYQQLDLLTGLCPMVGFTATPYRGTPKGTRELLEHWGEPIALISFHEAVAEGYIQLPEFHMLPLVDDDIIDISGGEFKVTSIDAATVDRLGDLADHCRQWYKGGLWDKATVFACASRVCCMRLQAELGERGIPSGVVSADTPKDQRKPIFDLTIQRKIALIQINIVSEGVDLPLSRLVDCAPTLSPVRWVQQVGRCTRPTADRPEYIGTNRNILRHSYALEGAVPDHVLVEAQKAFTISERVNARALGMEALGRFKPSSALLRNGLTVHAYTLSCVSQQGVVVEFCCVIHPNKDPIWASKVNVIKDGKRTYGSWSMCDAPQDLRGFGSVPPKAPSEKQQNWWNRSASWVGLDPKQELTRKNFVLLPVLSDLGVSFG